MVSGSSLGFVAARLNFPPGLSASIMRTLSLDVRHNEDGLPVSSTLVPGSRARSLQQGSPRPL